jgi:peptidoglycan hydrolase CwlO-like protein
LRGFLKEFLKVIITLNSTFSITTSSYNNSPKIKGYTMKKNFHNVLKLSAAITLLVLLGACANTSRIDRLESLVQEAQNASNEAQTAARDAQRAANSASDAIEEVSAKADSAQQTADRALNAVTECCAKVDRMFEKAMRK